MTPGSWSFETAARTLWQEARGEPDIGREAVAHVLWNRLKSKRWGQTLASVCLAPLQFSGWNVHDPNRVAVAELADNDLILNQCRTILAAAQNAPDPTNGAMYYYAPAAVSKVPDWAGSMQFAGQFGTQRFFRDAK